MTTKVQPMFEQVEIESLPLFSETAVRVSLEPAEGTPRAAGQLSFFACRFCKDGGRIGGRYCICEAGTAARLADREGRG
jgi:hypothetical protein